MSTTDSMPPADESLAKHRTQRQPSLAFALKRAGRRSSRGWRLLPGAMLGALAIVLGGAVPAVQATPLAEPATFDFESAATDGAYTAGGLVATVQGAETFG